MAKFGPPCRLTLVLQAEILQAAHSGLNITECAQRVGVGERTLYTWLDKGEKTREQPFHDLATQLRAIRADVTSVATRFWANVSIPTQAAGCWPWLGSLYHDGYGRVSRDGRQIGAHRVSYELHNGPIPEGMEIDHLCRSRECVNPLHLEVVTKRENAKRGISPVAEQMDRTHCKRGHDLTIPENMYHRPGGGTMCRPCQQLRIQRRRKVL